jgi:hypothetical protein
VEKDEPHASIGGNQREESADDSVRAPPLVSVTGQEEPQAHCDTKPSNCQGRTERFWDFKASHWVTAFLTAALVWVGFQQVCIYRRQAKIMETQANISAQQEADGRVSQRPFVYLSGLQGLYQDSASGPIIRINPVWGNSGNTPTVDLKIYASWKTTTSGLLPKEFNFPDLNAAGEEITDPIFTRTLLSPKVNLMGSDKEVTSEQIQAINLSGGNTILWGWGWARYSDQFRSRPHITRFCIAIGKFVVPTKEQFGAPGIPAGGSVQWKFCNQGNCADDECKKQ